MSDPYPDLELREAYEALCKRNAELEAENARLLEAIKNFAYSQRWVHQAWKDQPAIKPLFDIAAALEGEE